MLSAYKNDSVWADTGGLDASALIPVIIITKYQLKN